MNTRAEQIVAGFAVLLSGCAICEALPVPPGVGFGILVQAVGAWLIVDAI